MWLNVLPGLPLSRAEMLSGSSFTPWCVLLHITLLAAFYICLSQSSLLKLTPYSVSKHALMSDFSLSFWLIQPDSSCLILVSSAFRTSSDFFFTSTVSLESGCNVFYLPCSNSLCAPSPSHLPTEVISGNSSDSCLIISHAWSLLYQQKGLLKKKGRKLHKQEPSCHM